MCLNSNISAAVEIVICVNLYRNQLQSEWKADSEDLGLDSEKLGFDHETMRKDQNCDGQTMRVERCIRVLYRVEFSC